MGFLLCMGWPTELKAQTERLTLKRENASMLDIILAVENQSKMTFVYSMDAINKIRTRCGAEGVQPAYLADNHKFMDEIRRERAVELAMEGFRFNDLQRWLLLTESPYTEKYAVEFDRVENPDFYKTNDPADAEVANWHKHLLVKRVFGTKHYWFPLPDNDVYLYVVIFSSFYVVFKIASKKVHNAGNFFIASFPVFCRKCIYCKVMHS